MGVVASGGLDFCVSWTSFQKIDIGWPQQPLTEKVSDISEKMDFRWSILQKGTSIDHLGARDDQTIRISNFFDEMTNEAVEVIEAIEAVEATEFIEAAEVFGKSILRTSELSRHLNSALFLCFEKRNRGGGEGGGRIIKYHVEF
jgi:hypothetical protein